MSRSTYPLCGPPVWAVALAAAAIVILWSIL